MNSNNRVPISIVMPVYNRVTFLEESIDSVLSQQHPSYELLIVDDGSNIPAIENIFLEIEGHHKIRIIRKAHGGPGSAMNVGVSEAKNRYVCRLDSDDKITPDALPILQEYILANPNVSYFYSSRYVIDSKSNIVLSARGPEDGIHRSVCFNRFRLTKRYFCNHLICWNREDYLAVGGMREDIYFAEDWDLALRMSECYHFLNINEPLYMVREHDLPRLTNTTRQSQKDAIESDIIRSALERRSKQSTNMPDHQ